MICDVTMWTQSDVNSQGIEYLSRLFRIALKLGAGVTLITKFHDIATVISPWQYNGLQALPIQRVKSEFS